jgi:hypothetical protein
MSAAEQDIPEQGWGLNVVKEVESEKPDYETEPEPERSMLLFLSEENIHEPFTPSRCCEKEGATSENNCYTHK